MRWLLPTVVFLPLLAACVNTAAEPPPRAVVATHEPAPAPEPAACPGKIEAQDGLAAVSDEPLYKQAVGEPTKGSLCTGQVFEAQKPVKVYRVWNKAKAYTKLGRWWSFAAPKGPVAAYRAANAICPEWSDLDMVSECTLKVGAHVVVGPGQSAACKAESFPVSPTNQVFIPNETKDPANQKVFVENCTDGAPWP